MKFGPVTKLYKRNKTQVKKFDHDVMLANSEVIVIFPIWSNAEARFRSHSF